MSDDDGIMLEWLCSRMSKVERLRFWRFELLVERLASVKGDAS